MGAVETRLDVKRIHKPQVQESVSSAHSHFQFLRIFNALMLICVFIFIRDNFHLVAVSVAKKRSPANPLLIHTSNLPHIFLIIQSILWKSAITAPRFAL